MCYRFTYTMKITDSRIAAGAGPEKEKKISRQLQRIVIYYTVTFHRLVHGSHVGLKLGCFVVGDGRFVIFVVIFEKRGEHVGDSLTLCVAHYMDGGIYRFGQQLIGQSVALIISPDDAAGLPEAYLIEEFVSADSIFAYEQFIKVAGG